MKCPVCAREVPPNDTSCPNCASVATPGAEVLAVPLTQARARTPSKYSCAFRLGAWTLSAACWYFIVMMSLIIIVRTYGHFSAETSVRFVVIILANSLIPLIGVFLYYRKRTPRPPIHRKVLLVSVFAMVFSFLPYRGSWFS